MAPTQDPVANRNERRNFSLQVTGTERSLLSLPDLRRAKATGHTRKIRISLLSHIGIRLNGRGSARLSPRSLGGAL
jgi:hypothetical protein